MSTNFNIEYDSAGKKWLPAQLRVRMLARNPDGQYNPCSFGNPEFRCDPPGWLSFSPTQQGEIISADVSVTDQFISSKSTSKFSQPVTVTVKADPPAGAGENIQPLTAECTVTIAEPGQNMGFTVSPDDCYRDGEVWLAADGSSTCKLTVWVEEVDHATGQIYRAPEEDFDFMVETGFDPDTLFCPDIDAGKIKPVSTWRTASPMNDLRSPMQGKITIKAISRKEPAGRQVGKIDIPMVLFPAKVMMKAVYSPPLPAIPGNEVCVQLQLFQQSGSAPVKDTEVEFAWHKSCESSPVGSIAIARAKTDSEGNVEFRYSPPEELIYQSKKRYFDEITINIVNGQKRTPLEETLVIPVMPLVRFSGNAVKKGLKMDTAIEQIEILPEQLKGGEIRGNLILPASAEGKRKLFGVEKADLTLVYDGQDPGRPPVKTAKNGAWTIRLPELDEAMKKAELECVPCRLPVEPEKEQVLLMLLEETEEQLIADYEADIQRGISLYSAKFQSELKSYRLHFCSQLAKEEEENYELAISGVKLVQIAVRGSDMFFRRFKCHEDMVKSRFEGLVGSLINIMLGTAKASEMLRKAGGAIIGKGHEWLTAIAQSRFGRWIARGAAWLGSFATSIGQKAMNQIVPIVNKIGSGLQSFLAKIGNAGSRFVQGITSLIDDLVSAVTRMAGNLSEKISEFHKTLSETSTHWNELVEWVSQKKQSIGTAMNEASGWIGSFFKSLQNMIQAMLDMVGHLFVRIGQVLFKALSGILCWCGKKAKDLFSWMLEWLCDHSEPVKQKVEEIMKKTMNSEEFTGNGIEKLIDSFLNWGTGWLMNHPITDEIKDLDLQDIKMKFSVLGQQPNQVVGYVYRAATKQQLPRDWETQRSNFTSQMVELNTSYHKYQGVTGTIDEITDIIGLLITVGSLGVALLGIVFTGGTGIAVAVEAMATAEMAFNIAKACLSDLPQVGIAMFIMFALVIKYDMLITDLWLGTGSGASA